MRSKSISIILSAAFLFGSAAAHAQATSTQLLDRVFVFAQDAILEMPSTSDAVTTIYDQSAELDLVTCKLTALGGLYCLDGMELRHWSTPGTSEMVLDCGDDNLPLGLDTKKNNACTGMTVDFDGTIWLAGKSKGKSHILIKLMPVPAGTANCPDATPGTTLLSNPPLSNDLCAYEVATGRPLLVDLATISGTAAANFALPGHDAPVNAILGLEERKTAVAFLPDGEVVEIASGKSDWGLAGNEQLQGLTLWQVGDEPRNLILVTTSAGRILAWDTAATGPAQELHVIQAPDSPPADFDCADSDSFYGIRASDRTGTVFVTDRQNCRMLAFEADATTDAFTYLGSMYTAIDGAYEAPMGVTVAAGSNVNLANCSGECAVIPGDDPAGPAKVSMSSVTLADGSATGLTLFRIVGIPDCRYVPQTCVDTLFPGATGNPVDILIDNDVIVALDSSNAYNVWAQRLNMTPLLPAEVTDLFPGGLPALLLPRYMRGQAQQGFFFEALFGVPQKGVVFRDTFDSEYFVELLAGRELGCQDTHGELAWDMTATVSERFASPSDASTTDALHLARTTNSGCGSSRTRDGQWSIKPYNLEPTPCTFNPVANDVWQSHCDYPVVGDADDAVYAKMLLLFADEYQRTVTQFVCPDAPGEELLADDPNNPGDLEDPCGAVRGQVDNLIDKLHKCWDATMQPKQSSGDQNCQAFDSQLGNLQATLENVSLAGDVSAGQPDARDPANRLGELKARAATMRHVFETRFMPSLPDSGFQEPQPQN